MTNTLPLLKRIALCCAMMFIATIATHAQLQIACPDDTLVLSADRFTDSYTPNPFEYTSVVFNATQQTQDSVAVRIAVPEVFDLAGISSETIQELSNLPLAPGDSGTVTWYLRYGARPTTDKYYTIVFYVIHGNGIVDSCGVVVHVMPIFITYLGLECQTPNVIVFNTDTGLYEVNPFEVSTTLTVAGNDPADSIWVELVLPPDVVLVPEDQPLRIELGTIDPPDQGAFQQTFTWTVEWPRFDTADVVLDFEWRCGGIQQTDRDMIGGNTHCQMGVPGIKPYYQCNIAAPDTITIDHATGQPLPNPFVITYTLENISPLPGRIDFLTMQLPNDSAWSVRPIPPEGITDTLHSTIVPGNMLQFTYMLETKELRRNEEAVIRFIAYDEYGDTIYCEKTVYFVYRGTTSIPGTASPLSFSLDRNYPNPFSSTTEIGYSLSAASDVLLTVSNLLGEEVAVLVEARMQAGTHMVRFNAQGLPGGVYILRLSAGGSATSRVILLQR